MNSYHNSQYVYATHNVRIAHSFPCNARRKMYVGKITPLQKLNWCIGSGDNHIKREYVFVSMEVCAMLIECNNNKKASSCTLKCKLWALHVTLNHHSVKYLNWLWNILNGICRTRKRTGAFSIARVNIDGIFFASTKRHSIHAVLTRTTEREHKALNIHACRQRTNSTYCSFKQWPPTERNKCISRHTQHFHYDHFSVRRKCSNFILTICPLFLWK